MSEDRRKRKRQRLTLDQQMKAIKAFEEGESMQSVLSSYGLAKSTFYQLLQRKEQIQEKAKETPHRKSLSLCLRGTRATLDDRVYQWYLESRRRAIPVSGPLLQEAGRQCADALNYDFTASNGWLMSFRKRHNIVVRNLCGESAEVNTVVVEDFKAALPEILEHYEDKDIFNLDELGLFWRALPTRSLVTKGEEARGGKLHKDRVTVLLTVSKSGEKEVPYIIGKSRSPRAFNRQLPQGVVWRSNSKAWMTRSLFGEFMHEFNSKMRTQGRNVLLFYDNCPSHLTRESEVTFSNVRVILLPKNTTAFTQPLDAGMIKNFKYHYRRLLVEHLAFDRVDATAGDIVQGITMAHAVLWIRTAWSQVTEDTIRNCWIHAGFSRLIDTPSPICESPADTQSMAELLGQVQLSLEEFHFDEGDIPDTEGERDWEQGILCPETETEEVDDPEEASINPAMLAAAQRGLVDYLRCVECHSDKLGVDVDQYIRLREQLRKIASLRS